MLLLEHISLGPMNLGNSCNSIVRNGDLRQGLRRVQTLPVTPLSTHMTEYRSWYALGTMLRRGAQDQPSNLIVQPAMYECYQLQASRPSRVRFIPEELSDLR